MTTPLSKARRYKATFVGPRYAVGEMVNVRGDYRKVLDHSCSITIGHDSNGRQVEQGEWYYTIEADNFFPNEVFTEYDLSDYYMEVKS